MSGHNKSPEPSEKEQEAFLEMFVNAANGNIDKVKAALESGLNPKMDGSKALGAAVGAGSLEIVEMLLAQGANPNAIYTIGPHRNPLCCAVKSATERWWTGC